MENLSIAVTFSLIFLPFFVYSQTQKIDINSAPLEDLVKIIYIGEKRAKELISLRPFSSLDELTRIKGINKARLEEIKKQGLAYVKTEEKAEKDNNEKLKEEKHLLPIDEKIPKKPSLFPLFIALPLAIFSGMVILILKILIYKKIRIKLM